MSISRYLSQFADFLSSSGIFGVSGGGTGLTSTPSNGQLDIGNGSGFTRATLTQGTGITITNGAGSITIASSVSQPQVYSQVFFSGGSGTWTAPTGVTRVRVWCVGGGGGSSGGCPGANGGGGGVAVGVYTVTPGTGYTVTVGNGAAGASGGGGTGGTSSFGALCSATGGGGGAPGGTPGSRGSGTGGTIQNSSSYTGANQAYPAIWPPVGFNIAQASTSAAAASGANLGCGNGGYNGIIGGVGGMVYLEWVQ